MSQGNLLFSGVVIFIYLFYFEKSFAVLKNLFWENSLPETSLSSEHENYREVVLISLAFLAPVTTDGLSSFKPPKNPGHCAVATRLMGCLSQWRLTQENPKKY